MHFMTRLDSIRYPTTFVGAVAGSAPVLAQSEFLSYNQKIIEVAGTYLLLCLSLSLCVAFFCLSGRDISADIGVQEREA
jgi:hypothetical protein